MNDVVAIVMAGNNSLEVGEITANRSIGAVPFGAKYRTIDFILSNVVNSGIERVGVSTQTHYRSLMDHIGSAADWDLNRKRNGLLVLPPISAEVKGDIDILAGIKEYLCASNHKYVLLAGSDTVFNGTFNDFAKFHKKNHADITVMCSAVPVDEKLHDRIGIATDETGKVIDVEVNPSVPTIENCSMNVYFMEKDFLIYQIDRCLARDKHDFALDIILAQKDNIRMFAYGYSGYVGRIHDVASFYKCNMELLEDSVSKELFDANEKIYTKVKNEVPTIYGEHADVKNSMVADGCVIKGNVENSIIFRGVRIEEGATVKNSIVMQNSLILENSTIEHTITDKQVTVRKGKVLIGQSTYPVLVGKNATI